MSNKYIIFDLDDTLIYEIDFLKSAYREIAHTIAGNNETLFSEMFNMYQKGENVFNFLEHKFPNFSKEKLLELYRNHYPTLTLNEGASEIFNLCKSKGYKTGLITDGRSITQRNKLKAVGIETIFDKIVISEEFGSSKPEERNFTIFQENEIDEYYYIGDNPKKDFITPNKLGWTSICLLDKGLNIHSQNFDIDKVFLPKYKITSLETLRNIL
ncbi:MAG: HAD family hydrolase [Capnocytophaga sp.]|nr:HAD family hydrolase [Capnocytophaga sp.]